MTSEDQVIARYGGMQGFLGVLGLIVGFPILVSQLPLMDGGDYATFVERSRHAYGWLGLCVMTPVSVATGILILIDMIRMSGKGIVVRAGAISIGGPLRWSVDLADLERVELLNSPRGVRLWWRPGRSRAIASILMNRSPEEIRRAIVALLPEQKSAVNSPAV